MMKKIALLLTLFSFGISTFGQTDDTKDKKTKVGLGVGSYISDASNGINYNALLTLESGRSFFAIGPVYNRALTASVFGISFFQQGNYGVHSINFVYQFNLSPKAKITKFFFEYDFIYNHYIEVSTVDFDDYVPYNSNTSVTESNIGIGLKVMLSKHFYSHLNYGLGIYYSDIAIDFEDEEDQREYQYFYSQILKFGLGCNFR